MKLYGFLKLGNKWDADINADGYGTYPELINCDDSIVSDLYKSEQERDCAIADYIKNVVCPDGEVVCKFEREI